MEPINYDERVDSWLAEHSITYTATKTSEGPMSWDTTGQKRDIYELRFTRSDRTFTIPQFGQSLYHSSTWAPKCIRGCPMQFRESLMMHSRDCPNHKMGGRVRPPSAYDAFATITKYDPGSFSEFCSEFGYDTDSIKARDAWQAMVEEWAQVRRFFTSEEIEWLQENAQ